MVLPIPLFDYTLWILFSLFVGIALALDLGLLTKITSMIRFRSKQSEIIHKENKEEQKKIRAVVSKMDSVLKLDKDLNMAFLQQDAQRMAADKDKEARYKQWLSSLTKDIYLDQAVKTINDMVNQQNLVKSPSKEPVKSF